VVNDKRNLIYAFNTVIAIARLSDCGDLHHKKSQLHARDELCPVLYELELSIHLLSVYLQKEVGL